MYIYNLGKFRLKQCCEVYYMLFGFIPIYLFNIGNFYDIEDPMYKISAVKVFNKLVMKKEI